MLPVLAALALAPPSARVTAPIVSASLFKNGYAFVTREIRISGPGEVVLDAVPQSSYGTLWFQGADGARLTSVRTVQLTGETTEELFPPSTFEGLLANNVGRKVRLDYRKGEPNAPFVVGEVVSIVTNLVTLRTRGGETAFTTLGLSKVTPVDGKPFAPPRRITRAYAGGKTIALGTEGGAGRVLLVSLERGLSWTPGYAVNLTTEKELTLVAKATVVNNLENLRATDARLITGFPNLPYAQALDPFIEGLYGGMGGGGMGGGMGGGGGLGGGSGMDARFSQNAALPAAPVRVDFSQMEEAAGAKGSGVGRENLFFYKVPTLSMELGERRWQVILTMKAAYEHVYTWDVVANPTNDPSGYTDPVAGPGDVWHAVSFKNTSGQPLTTASAITTQKGEILGQDDLGYVPPEGRAELRITKALDIQAEIAESETVRERGVEKDDNGNHRTDRLTIKGALSVVNRKSVPVTVRVKRAYVGEPLRADGTPATDGVRENEPKIVANTRGLRALNPAGTLVWTLTLKPGEERKIAYGVRFLTPSR